MMDMTHRGKVRTAYGEGVILGFRPEDSMYLVQLHCMTTTTAALLYTQNPKPGVEDEESLDRLKDPALPVIESHKENEETCRASKSAESNCGVPTSSSSSSSSSGGPSALLQDADGKPLFPMLYKMRREGREFLGQSSQQIAATINNQDMTAWKEASQKALSSAHTNIKVFARSLSNPNDSSESVRTPYGVGRVVEYRELSATYVVDLSFGTLYTQDAPTTRRTPNKKKKAKTALELNDTFMQWEETRRQELQVECARLGIPYTDESVQKCFACLKSPPAASKPALSDGQGNPLFPRLYRLRQSGGDMMANKVSTDSPCLLCGAMTCGKHSSPAFRKEGIYVCMDCLESLEFDFETASLPEELKERTEHLVDLYGRATLLLQYCSQFMLATADNLEQNTKQHNEIAGVGGSGAGLVSGVLGVAAACSFLTPAGPPLLIASLVFGGSATAVQTGSEAYKYYSEPNQLANRILTLHGILEMILETTKSMRDTTLVPYVDQAILELETTATTPTAAPATTSNDKARVAVRAGTRIGSTAATSAAAGLVVQEGALAGRFVSRATTAAARTARFARFAGGALSAATLVLEARELRKTVDQIKLGNPCEKAQAVRTVHADLNKLPSKTSVERMCQSYVKVRSKELFRQAMAESALLPEHREEDLLLIEEVVSSLEDSQDDSSTSSSSPSTPNHEPRVKLSSRSSLLHRVKRYKEREAQKAASQSCNVD